MSIKLLSDNDKIEIGSFPDNTHIIHLESEKQLSDSITIKWKYETDEELFSLICITRYLQDQGVSKIDLSMPYIPNARFDRVNNQDEVFTLKYFAEVINSLRFNRVYVLDAHSNVSLALINNVVQLDVKPVIQHVIKAFKPEVLFMPDEGAHKRYGAMFNLPSTFGIKTRDWRTGDIKDYFLAEPGIVNKKKVLIIDDISSRGGTFYHAGQLLHDHGAKDIGLYISHCEPTIAKGNVFVTSKSHITHVYTADPLWKPEEIDKKSILNKVNILD